MREDLLRKAIIQEAIHGKEGESLPEEGRWVKLGDVAKIGAGATPKKHLISSEGTIPFFRIADMKQRGNEKIMNEACTFLAENYRGKVTPSPSIIYPKNGGAVYTNKRRLLMKPALVDLNTGFLVPNESVDIMYLYYWSCQADLGRFTVGTAIPSISTTRTSKILFPLPPLDEQKRIVQNLETVLPEIDALNEHIHRLNHAREVFWRSLIQEETHSLDEELPEWWRWVRLGDVCTLINGRAFKPNEWSKEGLPIVRIQNLNDPNAEYHYFNDEVEKKYMLYGQELLFAWSDSLGVYIWNGGKAVLNQHIFKVEAIEGVTIKSYIGYTLQAQLTKIKNLSHGTTMKHIRKGIFEAVTIPLPPLDEQRRIVQRLDNFHDAIFQL